MRSVQRWFEKQAAHQERMVLLEDALLRGRFGHYALYRLRYFLARTFVASVLHIVEFLFLTFMFREHLLITALLVRAASSFATSYWWGGLEVMRQRVRELQREGLWHQIHGVVSQWLTVALVCACLVSVLATTWVVIDSSRLTSSFGVFHYYVLANAVRLAVSVVTRTFHSGVYAVRRIYRPFWAIVGIDLSGFFGALALWPILGSWAFPSVLVGTAIFSGLVTLVFTHRAYRFLGFPSIRPVSLPFTSFFSHFDRHFLAAGMSYALMKLDAVVLFFLYFATLEGNRELYLSFYLIGPLVRASSDWAQLFYFDLKRLEAGLFANFKRSFERLVASLSVIVGGLFAIAAALSATILLQRNLGAIYVAIAAFFLLRSRLAFHQIRAFTERRYFQLFVAGQLIILGVVFIGFFLQGGTESKLAGLAVVPVLGLVYLSWRSIRRHQMEEPESILPPQRWLGRLARMSQPVRVRKVELHENTNDWFVEDFAEELSLRLGPAGGVTLMGERQIVWFEPTRGQRVTAEGWLSRRGGGLIDDACTLFSASGGEDAVARASQDRFIGRKLRPEVLAGQRWTLESVKSRFRALLPDGLIYEPGVGNSEPEQGLQATGRHQVLRAALRYSRNPLRRIPGQQFDVTTLCDSGSIRLIFAAPKSAEKRLRNQWKKFITGLNLHSEIRSVIADEEHRGFSMRYKPAVMWSSVLAVVVLLLVFVQRTDRAYGPFELAVAVHEEVRAPVAGFLEECLFEEGDRVEAGEPICRLQMPELGSRIAQTRAEASSLQAILQNLRSRGEYSRPADWARLAGLTEEVRYLEEVQQKLVLSSAASGLITTPDLQKKVGRYFREGELIFEVQDPSLLEAKIALPERQVERVREGRKSEFKVLALPYDTFHGTVSRVAAAVEVTEDGKERAVTAYAQLEGGAPELRPGMTGHARIITGERSIGAILVDRVLRFLHTEFWW